METRQLLTWYCRVVELGSFSAAARELDLVPSSLSRAIQQLEAELGVTLLSRSTRRVAPTEAGRLYHQRAQAMLDAMDDAREAVLALEQEPRGRLRVAAPTQFGLHVLTPLLPRFLARFPRLDLELQFDNAKNDMEAEDLDVVLRVQPMLPEGPFQVEALANYRRILVASPDYLARAGTPQRPEELTTHRCLTLSATSWFFHIDGCWQEVPLARRHCVNLPEATLRLAEAGVGIAQVGDYQCADALEDGRLVRVLDAFEPPQPVSLYALYPRRTLPGKSAAFLDFLRKNLPKTLQHLS